MNLIAPLLPNSRTSGGNVDVHRSRRSLDIAQGSQLANILR